ncbi:uncharacterized protein A4U43_C03F4240 [Asparagus officinalis]|uniref:Uncharacterized protein n=1 Tax=Asparagus officinalis TaxID=4686 RepID=A0A5P1FC91_ASPOF|nr:uncharacterized protein A4U43_C03F4240 [Asparagus officinalis]
MSDRQVGRPLPLPNFTDRRASSATTVWGSLSCRTSPSRNLLTEVYMPLLGLVLGESGGSSDLLGASGPGSLSLFAVSFPSPHRSGRAHGEHRSPRHAGGPFRCEVRELRDVGELVVAAVERLAV